jgi:hypothetical protein
MTLIEKLEASVSIWFLELTFTIAHISLLEQFYAVMIARPQYHASYSYCKLVIASFRTKPYQPGE